MELMLSDFLFYMVEGKLKLKNLQMNSSLLFDLGSWVSDHQGPALRGEAQQAPFAVVEDAVQEHHEDGRGE